MKYIRPFDGCKILYLAPDSKEPDTKLFPHGHLGAIECPLVITQNYGIVLDGQYICVDIDDLEAAPQEFKHFETWSQITKKGYHYLFKAPKGFKGGNVKLKNASGEVYGDLKSRGYIVGPGSTVKGHTYFVTQPEYPAECPPHVLQAFQAGREEHSQSDLGGIPQGSHDDFLVSLAGYLRGRQGLSESAIYRILRNGPLAALQDQDPGNPYTDSDLHRIARSVGSKPANKASDSPELLVKGWKTLTDTETRKSITKWLLYRFIPRSELVLMFGKGGIGKSSLASWIASHSIKKGLKVGFCGVEEPFNRFGIRAWLSDKYMDSDSLFNIGSHWRFPTDADKFREALKITPLDVVYFDSIYNHFDVTEGLNAAERARACLSPLTEIAQELGVTIIGTFHENKAGNFLGSTEMENVTRMLLKVSRAKDKPLRLHVSKTNFIEPDHDLYFEGELTAGCSLDGSPWLEEDDEGNVIPEMFYVVNSYRKTSGEVPVELEDPRWESISKFLSEGLSIRGIANELELPKSTVGDIIKRKGKITRTTHIALDEV